MAERALQHMHGYAGIAGAAKNHGLLNYNDRPARMSSWSRGASTRIVSGDAHSGRVRCDLTTVTVSRAEAKRDGTRAHLPASRSPLS